METRAHFIVIGGFVVAVLVGLFTFIYWLQNAGGFGKQAGSGQEQAFLHEGTAGIHGVAVSDSGMG